MVEHQKPVISCRDLLKVTGSNPVFRTRFICRGSSEVRVPAPLSVVGMLEVAGSTPALYIKSCWLFRHMCIGLELNAFGKEWKTC